MRNPLAPLAPLALSFALALGCGGAKDDKSDEPAGGPAKIEAVGVQVELPAGWSYAEKNGGHWVSKGAFYGAQLQKMDAMPGSLEDAKKGWMEGTVKDEGEKGGAFYAVVEVEFPGDEAMKLPYVYVIAPVGDAAVQCSGQLQAGDDAKALVDVCLTMKPL